MMRYCILRQRYFQAFFLKITMTTADWLLLALHTLSVNRAGMKLRRTPPSVVHICDQLRKRRIVSRVQARRYHKLLIIAGWNTRRQLVMCHAKLAESYYDAYSGNSSQTAATTFRIVSCSQAGCVFSWRRHSAQLRVTNVPVIIIPAASGVTSNFGSPCKKIIRAPSSLTT